ncbi:hypothetical protein OQA88_11021 [Cercophora sp. LCS_1]
MWTEFKPAGCVLEAQSDDHVFSSTVIRGLGLTLSYRRLGNSRKFMLGEQPVPDTFVCSTQTDMMWFGILPGNVELALPNLAIGTNEDIQHTLAQLDHTGRAGEVLANLQREDHHRLHGFCDIVPMVAPWPRQLRPTINPHPRPCPCTHGLTWYCVVYRAFHDRLKHYNATKDPVPVPDDYLSARWVQRTYQTPHDKFGDV